MPFADTLSLQIVAVTAQTPLATALPQRTSESMTILKAIESILKPFIATNRWQTSLTSGVIQTLCYSVKTWFISSLSKHFRFMSKVLRLPKRFVIVIISRVLGVIQVRVMKELDIRGLLTGSLFFDHCRSHQSSRKWIDHQIRAGNHWYWVRFFAFFFIALSFAFVSTVLEPIHWQ